MTQTLYYMLCSGLVLLVLAGIAMMSKVRTAKLGNQLSALSMLLAIVLTFVQHDVLNATTIYLFIAIGSALGLLLALRVKMIEIPQLVAVLNGLGGGASALVGILALRQLSVGQVATEYPLFYVGSSMLAILIGMMTLVGSFVAAGKLHKLLPQKPIVYPLHNLWTNGSLVASVALVALSFAGIWGANLIAMVALIILSSAFGWLLAARVGGADMPITISLLNSFSGLAGAIAGMATGDLLLIAIGGVVGASGLLLTQIMCRAMNRSLMSILLGTGLKAAAPQSKPDEARGAATASPPPAPVVEEVAVPKPLSQEELLQEALTSAREVIIVPGYGMALSQAQHELRSLADKFTSRGARVRYAIHPVAGRMPGHMNVLLCEADVAYEDLYEMEAINDDFAGADLVIVVGANDVLNPAAREAEGTPIYGMPILNVDAAKRVIICNYDLNPGYAGVPNPLYARAEGVFLRLGDAKQSLKAIIELFDAPAKEVTAEAKVESPTSAQDPLQSVLTSARNIIIVPGYGMALSQAQHELRSLADKFTSRGAQVRYAIHPVAGRMPGHMNVLLCEADVAYEDLYEMEVINGDFAETDLVIVVGANDVLNPAAREAEGTPIYGMPILNVDAAKHVVICNYDLNPGYAGVPNPLYTRAEGVFLRLGDAKQSLKAIIELFDAPVAEAEASPAAPSAASEEVELATALNQARNVIIVPGYGMALSQAQHELRTLADKLTTKGATVRYAIHPVAGRMPGHMNVLLCEADVAYEDLYEMEAINDNFAGADLVIVVGANDVLNPAAREAEGTPIYGMPILNVDAAKRVIICNYDLNPGYAGVPNPLYARPEGVFLRLGDAKQSLKTIIELLD